MTALSAQYECERQDGEMIDVPVLADAIIYKGALLVDKGTGFASAGVATGSYVFLGVAAEGADATGLNDGDKSVRVYKNGTFKYTKPAAVQSDLTVIVYLRDDQTVDTTVTNSIAVGTVVKYVDSTHVKVRIDSATK